MKNQHIIPSIHSPFIYFASLFSFLYLQSSLLSLYTSLAVPPPIPLPTTSLYLFSVSLQRVRVVDLEEGDLQDVWLLVNQEVLKRILRVLPERHPSYKYTSDLEDLFRKIQQVFPPQSDEREPPERIEEIYNRVKEPNSKGWRFVTPKSLLDNCYRTMHCLFKNCFPSEDGVQDYCSTLHWRKGRKRQLQET
uniref:Interleukin 34 n=1 Tax=Oncorhynchus mykiss TaxID=8022 RepID=A0A8C7PU24_ONCMY